MRDNLRKMPQPWDALRSPSPFVRLKAEIPLQAGLERFPTFARTWGWDSENSLGKQAANWSPGAPVKALWEACPRSNRLS